MTTLVSDWGSIILACCIMLGVVGLIVWAPKEESNPKSDQGRVKIGSRILRKARRRVRFIRRMKTMVKPLVMLAGALSMTMGAHGLYVYANRETWTTGMEVYPDLFSNPPYEAPGLFLAIGMPQLVDWMMYWMSDQGYQSWMVPTVFVVGGIILVARAKQVTRALARVFR